MKRLRYLALLPLFAVSARSQNPSTWETIQEKILNQNCVGCHIAGSSFARQSDLVLTPDVAYDNLVGVRPRNTAAAADSLWRVSRAGGFQGMFLSYLLEKIDAPNQEHFYNGHPGYGQLMPLGLPYLTNGQIAFIKKWLEAGAPRSGEVASTALLDDSSRYEIPEFRMLAEPEQGFQLHLGPFDVWPAQVHDREFLYFEPYETTEDLFITRYEIVMRRGSHHFILYNYAAGAATPAPRVFRDLRNQSGAIDFAVARELGYLFPFRFFVGTQTPLVNFYFPKGVALRLPKGSGFDFNSHSVNRTNQTQPGEIVVNIHTVAPSEVEHLADYDNFGNTNIVLPPQRETTISKTVTFNSTRSVIQLWTHAHEHMTEFSVIGVSGQHKDQLLYWTNDWEHPPVLELDPPLVFKAGDQIKMVTTYNNTTNQTITYGPLSSDEMQFIFYIYYPGEPTTAVANNRPVLPETFELAQNFPNPFNPATEIRYSLPHNSLVELTIHDLNGRHLHTLVKKFQTAGTHSAAFNATGMPSGVYFYHLIAGEYSEAKKMIVAK